MANRRQFVQSAASLAALSALPAALRAQGFEQVKIINGFPAGGTADATARRVAERMGGTAYTRNAAPNWPARCPAASARCWPSAARSWHSPSC